MSIRNKAIPWFHKNYPDENEPVKVSKYYIEAESWTKSAVWWFELPEDEINSNPSSYTNLLCEIKPNDINFYFLRVPNKYFIKNKPSLFMREKNDKLVYSIYLSANTKDIFIEQRGSEKTHFSSFLKS